LRTFDDFLAIQERNYNGIRERGALIAETGIIPDPAIAGLRGGITIALLPEPDVAKAFESFSAQVAKIVPAIAYPAQALHTTLVVGGTDFKVPFSFSLDDPEDARVVEVLTRACAKVASGFTHSCAEIFFEDYLLSDQVIVARGKPKKVFVELVDQLVEACEAQGLAVKGAWGAHATVSRFLEARSPEEARKVIELVKKRRGPGNSRATRIAVGYSAFNEPDGSDGRFKTIKVFELGKKY